MLIQQDSHKAPMVCLLELERLILKFNWKRNYRRSMQNYFDKEKELSLLESVYIMLKSPNKSLAFDSLSSLGLQLAGLLCPWNSPGQNTRVGSHFFLQGNLPNPGIEPRSTTLQADSLPSEPPGKPRNTGVGSLSLLQGIFLTEESKQGLLHCRRIMLKPQDLAVW